MRRKRTTTPWTRTGERSPTLASQVATRRVYTDEIETLRRSMIAKLALVAAPPGTLLVITQALGPGHPQSIAWLALATLTALLALFFAVAADGREMNDLVKHHREHHVASPHLPPLSGISGYPLKILPLTGLVICGLAMLTLNPIVLAAVHPS